MFKKDEVLNLSDSDINDVGLNLCFLIYVTLYYSKRDYIDFMQNDGRKYFPSNDYGYLFFGSLQVQRKIKKRDKLLVDSNFYKDLNLGKSNPKTKTNGYYFKYNNTYLFNKDKLAYINIESIYNLINTNREILRLFEKDINKDFSNTKFYFKSIPWFLSFKQCLENNIEIIESYFQDLTNEKILNNLLEQLNEYIEINISN